MDMRYIWSLMLSPLLMLNLRQPSRLFVLRRSRRWRKGSGEVECSSGCCESVDKTECISSHVECR